MNRPRKTFFQCVAIIFAFILTSSGCQSKQQDEVVVYTSLDQIFSEPILQSFEDLTSIKVKALYDVEATKTVGLVNRLIAEKDNPKADVFWNSEIVRTIVLKKKGVLSPYYSANAKNIPKQFKDLDGYWTGFAARARVVVVNKDQVEEKEYPRSIWALIDPKWKGRGGLSLPLFGTTNTHAMALFQLWGTKKAEDFFRRCIGNQVQILAGNSVVRDRVADGLIEFGVTDTDDVYVGIQRGKPITLIYPDQDGMGTLLIPNTVALIDGAPHSKNGKKLIDFLLSEKVEEILAFSASMQIPLRPQVKRPSHCPSLKDLKVMDVNYETLGQNVEEYSELLREIFMNR